jgi:DnaJ family protein C protein 25
MIFLRTIFVCWALAGVGAQEDTETSSSASSPPPNEEEINVAFDAKDHTDWGSYYDPKNIFCGTYDCYSILGFDYEEFGSNRPSRKEITKRYRALSREWHPDKSKHKDAKERFVVRKFLEYYTL